MTNKEFRNLFSYLKENCADIGKHFEKDGDVFTGKFACDLKCKKNLFNEIFESQIECSQYDVVAHGEGNEEEKIDSVYSSSLQSLLAFHGVNKKNKIRMEIGGDVITFDKVFFEYRNKVIGYPSSVDVVLVSEDNKSVAFIESKFLEIVRDSTAKTGKKPAERKVVGISYFDGNNPNSYKKALNLSPDDLNNLSIFLPEKEAFKEKGKTVSYLEDGYFASVSGLSDFKGSVGLYGRNEYVYSEGIKQILSHIIGIQNFKNDNRAYGEGKDPLENIKPSKVFYVELYNKFPGFDFAQKRIEDFKKHACAVGEVIMDKKTILDGFLVTSYQELFGADLNSEFVLPQNVRKYFRF